MAKTIISFVIVFCTLFGFMFVITGFLSVDQLSEAGIQVPERSSEKCNLPLIIRRPPMFSYKAELLKQLELLKEEIKKRDHLSMLRKQRAEERLRAEVGSRRTEIRSRYNPQSTIANHKPKKTRSIQQILKEEREKHRTPTSNHQLTHPVRKMERAKPSISLANHQYKVTKRLKDAETHKSKINNRQPAQSGSIGGSSILPSVADHKRRMGVNHKSNGADPQYTYDLNGNRTSMITPYGTWTYTYDIMDRVTSITNPNNEVTSFTYDALGRRTSMTYGNGIVTTYNYDAGSQLTNLTTRNSQLATLNSYAYTYDQVHNRTSMTDNHGTHTYAYDDVYQLINATHPQAYNPDETFIYNPVGNRLSSHLSNAYSYDNMNRLLEDDSYMYNYDANGNLTSRVDKATSDTTTYQYDAEDKLVQIMTPTDFVEYRYDGFGRRIAKTVNGVVAKYVYDREDILFELDGSNNVKARYTHGPGIDEPISVDRDTDADGTFDVTFYYSYDGLGSVAAIVDGAGNVVKTYEYDTFGNIVNQTGSIENPYAYTGREWDAKARLYFYRARYYDPTIGRFVTNDPKGFAGGNVNFYVYVKNNPVNYFDPDGQSIILTGIGVAVVLGTLYYIWHKWTKSHSYKEAVEANKELIRADRNPNTTIEEFVEKYDNHNDARCNALEEAELVIKLIQETKVHEQIKLSPTNPAKEIKDIMNAIRYKP